MKPQIPWLRVFIEGVVIVGSILLALGLESWSQDRQERASELEALTRLDAEFAEVDQVMAQWRDAQSGVVEASRVLLADTGPTGGSDLAVDSIGALIATISRNWTLDPPSAILKSMEASGQLGALRNHELLAALASWQAAMADLRGDEESLQQIVNLEIAPFLNSRVAYRTVSIFDRGISATESGPASEFPDGLREVLRSRLFENLLDVRLISGADIVNNYDVMRAELGTLRALIQQELTE